MLERLNEEIKRRGGQSFPTRRVAYVWSEPSVPKPTRAGSSIGKEQKKELRTPPSRSHPQP